MKRVVLAALAATSLMLTSCLVTRSGEPVAMMVEQMAAEEVPQSVGLLISNDTNYEITAVTVRAEDGSSSPLDVLIEAGSEVSVESPAGAVTLTAYIDVNGNTITVSEDLVLPAERGAEYRWTVYDLPPEVDSYGYLDEPSPVTYDPYAYYEPVGGYGYLNEEVALWLAALVAE